MRSSHRPLAHLLLLAPAALVLLAVLPPAGAAPGTATGATSAQSAAPHIPFQRYQLANGLTVILHEDHTQPLVVVNVAYQVGARDEPAKRTGFAHLFEHLMFMGTKRVPTKMFDEWMEREGAWNNAFTNKDRTVFYDVGPSHSLPLLLWMEADRMWALGPDMTAEKLDAQREVVLNERRESENEPFGKAAMRLPELVYPASHPYAHPVLGSHADVEAATVADVRDFFAKWYQPNNASVVIAGDFDPTTTQALVEKYFGRVPRGAPAPPRGQPAAPAKLTGIVREQLEDAVSLPKLIMVWHSPALYQPGDAELDLLAAVASRGKGSRLYKSLVFDQQLAQSVSAYQASGLIRSTFRVEATARPGVTLDQLEAAIDEQLAGLRSSPITADELSRAKNHWETSFVAQTQSLRHRATLLNTYQAYVGTPDYIAKDLARYLRPTTAEVQRMVDQTLLPNARVIMRIVPRSDEGEQQ